MKRSETSAKSILLLFSIILLIISSVIAAYFFLGSNHIEEKIHNKKNIALLFSFSRQDKSFMIELFLYNTVTHKGAIIFFPGNLWTKVDSPNRYAKIETVYKPSDVGSLIGIIEKITNLDIPFYFDIKFDNIAHLVDLIGGITVENRATLESDVGDRHLIFKKGSMLLDGERAQDYLLVKKSEESDIEQDQRKQEFLKSLLKRIADKTINTLIRKPDPQHYLDQIIKSNLTANELFAFIEELRNLRTKNIISRRVRGIVQTNTNGDTALFPLEEGEYLKFTVQHTLDVIANAEVITEEDLTVNLEILNGTDINHLATNTTKLFRKFGYQIESFGNADNHDYVHTVVIDRKGNKKIAQRVADLIKCKNIITKTDGAENNSIDVSIILGRDFDGRYCK
jgi:LCP family protein required for cell wall assembly